MKLYKVGKVDKVTIFANRSKENGLWVPTQSKNYETYRTSNDSV